MNHPKDKYKALNERQKDKSYSLVAQFNDNPIGAYFNKQLGHIENVLDHQGNSAINCLAFDGIRVLHGCNAQLFLYGTVFKINDIMGRDVAINEELNKYGLNIVDTNPLKVRLVFTDTTKASVDLNVESLFALQVLEMKSRAETQFENYMQNVLFIVPTSYTIRQIQAVKDAANIAGIDHAHILSQMSAAAIDFGFNTNDKNTNFREVLVIMFSSNECELALIEYYNQSIKYLAYYSGVTRI
ncbi:unnamed protein product [Oppiella nova]|uniref:Uncharacterized protein n=1 Tax=Oppiella nova TaxID=334625 RepID=A0A7R9Q943_9ACAR|nr:unnamed protein product [Oppiella nova]CAG2159433.1 unnamed protein product [Oppiella nova]